MTIFVSFGWIVVCEWVGGDLLVMGCCVVCGWRCFYELCGCVNGASPVRFVLSLFYLNPVCVVCVVTSDRGLFLVYLFVTKVTNPYDWSVFVCVVGLIFDSTSPAFVRSRASQAAGSDGRLAHKRNRTPSLGPGLCRHNLCRYLQHSNLVHAVSFWNLLVFLCSSIACFLIITLLILYMIRKVLNGRFGP